MYIDHVGINTNDMEATLQFYCGILEEVPSQPRQFGVSSALLVGD